MTKTQANEPGFVLANEAKPDPRIAPLAKALEAKRAELISQPLSFIWNDLAKVALDSALLVTSPAYGGVKALEPFAKSAHGWEGTGDSKHLGSCHDLTVGDVRRARAAYDAFSPVAVEEADVKAGEPIGWDRRYPSVFRDAEGRSRLSVAQYQSHDTIVFGRMVEKVPGVWHETYLSPQEAFQFALAILSKPMVAALASTPSPQIGKAGAGPVGGAVAWRGITSAPKDGTPVLLRFGSGIVVVGWWTGNSRFPWSFIDTGLPIVGSGLNRAVDGHLGPSHWMPMPSGDLASHPVEEPGEVKQGADYRLINDTVLMGMARDEAIERAEAAEAALAETREHLEKLLAASGKARTALAGFTSADDAAFELDVAIGDIAERTRRAALTGDAQEGGR